MNSSLIFGIPSSASVSKPMCLYKNRQNCQTALKTLDAPRLSTYTQVVLNHIEKCVSKEGMVLPPKKWENCIKTLEDLPRSNTQREIENTIKKVSTNIICYGTSDVRRDSAALWAMSDLMQDLDNGKILKADEKNTTDYLICCLKCCKIPCAVVTPSQKRALAGDADTNKKNQDNLNIALLELGFTDVNHPAVVKTAESLMAGTGIVPPKDIAEQLIALGIPKDASKSFLLKAILKQKTGLGTYYPVEMQMPEFQFGTGTGGNRAGLGTYYPVQLQWPEFPFGTGTGAGGKYNLGTIAQPAAQQPAAQQPAAGQPPPPKPTNWEKTQTAFVDALPELLKAGTDLAKQFGEAKIKEMSANFDAQMKSLMAQQTGQSTGSITQEQMQAWAQQNQEATQAALAAAAAKSQVDLAALQANQNKTLMYVGIGVGALLMVGLIAVIATRK